MCDLADIKDFLIKDKAICKTDDSSLLSSPLGDVGKAQLEECREQLVDRLGQDSHSVSQDARANRREKSNPAGSTESQSNPCLGAVGD